MKQCVDDLARVKSEQNIHGALSIYHPEAKLVSVGLGVEARGSIEIEQQLRVFYALFPDYRVELKQVACNDQSLLATGIVDLTPSIPGHSCQTIQQETSFAFTFKDGRIFQEYFYLDFGLVCQKAKISPAQFLEATNLQLSLFKATANKYSEVTYSTN